MKMTRSGYYHQEALSLVSSLPERSVDVTVSSPPYGALKNYGHKDQIGFGQAYPDYLKSLSDIFAELYAKTKDSGSLWLIVDTYKEKSQIRLLPFDLTERLRALGWQLQDLIIWNKAKTLPWSRSGQFRKIFEYILFFAKTKKFKYFIDRIKEPDGLKEWWVKYPERYSPRGKVPSTIWNFPIPVQGSWSGVKFRHFCPFPAELIQRILTLTTDQGDLVLDPFAGSGTVLAQAKVMGRRFIGGDINRTYQKQFYKVITNHIGEKWSKSKETRTAADVSREQLAQTIRKLRQVKFPKALFKELRKCLGTPNLTGVTAILAKAVPLNGNAPKHSFSQMVIYFLCDRQAPARLIEQEARKLILKAPLSKYGLVAEVHAHRYNKFWHSGEACLLAGQTLFVYSEGTTNMPKNEVRLVGGIPPEFPRWARIPSIVTNIEVRQEPIHTWSPKKPKQALAK
ncbi:MAG: DNA-methyltransferase [Candidatus Acidiferrales bacterium]